MDRTRTGLAALVLAASLAAGIGPVPRASDAGTSGCSAWTVVPSPNGRAPWNQLLAVSALGPSDAWAVGSTYTLGGRAAGHTLIERWDGMRWSVVPSPDGPDANNALQAVAVLSSTDVWAVGYSATAENSYATLSEHWDGVRWSVVPTPGPLQGARLNGVVALAPDDVWAVGYADSSGPPPFSLTLTEHWDGHVWTIVTSPNPGARDNSLFGVAASGAHDLWTAGEQTTVLGAPHTLIEQGDGAQWHVVPSPNPVPNGFNYLLAVSALSPGDAWAAGYTYDAGGGTQRNLIEHWVGQRWRVSAAVQVQIPDALRGVAAAGAQDVWAVGDDLNRSGAYETLTEHWDGQDWSVVPSPNPGALQNFLQGVAHVPGTPRFLAVGYALGNGGPFQTLIEQTGGCAGMAPWA